MSGRVWYVLLTLSSFTEDLRYYRYCHEEFSVYRMFNESFYRPVNVCVTFPENEIPIFYDALDNRFYEAKGEPIDRGITLNISLAPYETLLSCCLVMWMILK